MWLRQPSDTCGGRRAPSRMSRWLGPTPAHPLAQPAPAVAPAMMRRQLDHLHPPSHYHFPPFNPPPLLPGEWESCAARPVLRGQQPPSPPGPHKARFCRRRRRIARRVCGVRQYEIGIHRFCYGDSSMNPSGCYPNRKQVIITVVSYVSHGGSP